VGDDFCTGVLGRVNAQVVAAVAARSAADMNFIFVVVCILFLSGAMLSLLCQLAPIPVSSTMNPKQSSYDNFY